MKVVMVERIAFLSLEVIALLQVMDPIIAKQAHLAVVTVGRRLARLANRQTNRRMNRMVCR